MDYLVAVLLPQLLHGLVFGAALGLLALGLTVIFGLLGVMNFAHGELYMLGAYAGIAVIGVTHSFWVALLVAPLLVGVVGAVTEMTTLRLVYNREPLYGLILTFGLALVFREGARQIWGGDMRRILPPVTGSTPLLGMTYPNYRLFLLAISSVLLLAIWLFFTKTRAGILVRAAVQDAEMLDGLGVNVPRVFTLTFAGSAALAALAGLLLAPVFTVYPYMGVEMILLAFIVVILGGMGSMGGSVVGAIAMSLDLLIGYTGLVSFGHAAFYGLGAYATAVLLERGVQSLWLCVAFALVVVGLYALVVGYFATARRGIYFALLTLIFAEVVYTFFRYTQTFGGSDGIQGLPDALLWRGVAIDTPQRKYYLVLVYLAAAYAICRVVVTSHFGRVLVAIRENEDRARFLGYNVQRYKMAACMISALLTGTAGAIYPIRSAFATPDLMLWTESGEFIISVMIGGLGTLAGPILGGAFFTILRDKVSSFVDWYFIVIGVVLVLIVLFMPKGLLGIRRLRGFRQWRQGA